MRLLTLAVGIEKHLALAKRYAPIYNHTYNFAVYAERTQCGSYEASVFRDEVGNVIEMEKIHSDAPNSNSLGLSLSL